MLRPVTMTLDKPRKLLYDFAAFMALEEATGFSVVAHDGLTDEFVLGTRNMLELVRAGCLHEDPDLTVEQIAKGLPVHALRAATPAIVEAVQASLTPVDPPKAAGDATTKPPRGSAGKRSGPSPSTTSD